MTSKWTPEYRSQYMKEYNKRKKEELWILFIIKRNKSQAKYYAKNREACNKTCREHYWNNRESILARLKKERDEALSKKIKTFRNNNK